MYNPEYRQDKANEPLNTTFVEHQDNMVRQLKNIARAAQDMTGKANTKPKELGGIAQNICKNYNALSEDTKHAIRLSNQPDVIIYLINLNYVNLHT